MEIKKSSFDGFLRSLYSKIKPGETPLYFVGNNMYMKKLDCNYPCQYNVFESTCYTKMWNEEKFEGNILHDGLFYTVGKNVFLNKAAAIELCDNLNEGLSHQEI